MNRILVVEDDTSISNVIEISLRNAGYLCDCVYDGTSVSGQLEQEVYDLALVDIMLPGPGWIFPDGVFQLLSCPGDFSHSDGRCAG